MSRDELLLIVKILELKELKSNFINTRSYDKAADTRDQERLHEWKLLKILGFTSRECFETTNMRKDEILSDYFLEKFNIKYQSKITNNFKKSILRQIKLNELGI